MAIFTDDFERANGDPGANWVVYGGPPTIQGGLFGAQANWNAHTVAVSETGRNEAEAYVYWVPAASQAAGPAVKVNAEGTQGYLINVQGTASPYKLRLHLSNSYVGSVIGETDLIEKPPPYFHLRVVWEDGHLSGYYQGQLLVEADHTTYAPNPYMGLSGINLAHLVANFRCEGGSPAQFGLNNPIIPNYGECVDVDITGVGTNWTPGTPGSPIFTVDHGTISAQTIHTATTATLTYCPGNWLGPVTFTDPSTGRTTGGVVTSDPTIAPPPSATGFTPQAIAMVNNTAGTSWLETLTRPYTPISVTGGATLTLENLLGKVALQTSATVDPVEITTYGTLDKVWEILTHRDPAGTDVSFRDVLAQILEDTADLRLRWLIGQGPSEWTIQEILDLIQGTGDRNLTEVYEAVQGIQGGSNAEVLAAIAALRGDETTTVAQIRAILEILRTNNNWTLGDVKTWIEAIETGSVDLSPVLTAISNLSSQLSTATTNIRNDIAGLGIVLTAVQLATSTIETTVGTTAEIAGEILDIVSQLRDTPSAVGAPVWPGLDNATIGPSVELGDGVSVAGPLHGLLFNITGTPPNAGRYMFGSVHSWTHLGAVMFRTDEGAYERAEQVTVDQYIIVPKTMRQAASALLRINQGYVGTVRPWSID